LFFFYCPKEEPGKGHKTMLPSTGRPHPRRFFRPAHKEDVERMRSDEEADTFCIMTLKMTLKFGIKKNEEVKSKWKTGRA
jgi:hypothetical protein